MWLLFFLARALENPFTSRKFWQGAYYLQSYMNCRLVLAITPEACRTPTLKAERTGEDIEKLSVGRLRLWNRRTGTLEDLTEANQAVGAAAAAIQKMTLRRQTMTTATILNRALERSFAEAGEAGTGWIATWPCTRPLPREVEV